jgi:hypothetical protein
MSTKAWKMLLKRLPKNVTQTPLENAANSLKLNTYGYKPGSPVRADKATKTKGARSNIYSDSLLIKKKNPEDMEAYDSWIRGAYLYARDPKTGTKRAPLEGYPYFETGTGDLYRAKPNQGFAKGYLLKAQPLTTKEAYEAKRLTKEKPWDKPEQHEAIIQALDKRGYRHLFIELIELMKSDYKKKVGSFKKLSKGHIIPVNKGGLDVAENIMGQEGKSYFKLVDGKRVEVPGNYAQGDKSDLYLGKKNKGVASWDDYIEIKLPELLERLKK